MPIYDYKCQECGHSFEGMATIKDRTKLKECPACGVEAGKHIITPVSFHLPGHSYDYPTAADKWTREHERAGARGKKKEEEEAKDLASSMY